MLAGWVMTVAVLFAPATRIGYLLYPINFFVWACLLRGDRTRCSRSPSASRAAGGGRARLSQSSEHLDQLQREPGGVGARSSRRAPRGEASWARPRWPASQYQPS